MPRVICAGHVNWDVTLRVEDLPVPDGEATITSRTESGGGSAANVAATLSSLGVSAALLGSVGGDDRGTHVRGELAAAGVECAHLAVVPDRETATKYLVVDEAGEVMVLGCEGANEAFDGEMLPEAALRAADHLHLTSQRPASAVALARRAAEADVTVSFDPGRTVTDREYAEVFAHADVVFVNDREAAALVDADVPHPGQLLVRKRGREGAELRTGDRTVAHPGYPVAAVDTTGAGDAFAAGFIAARLDGRDEEGALAVANACGALASNARGARTRISWTDVDALLDAE